MTNEKLYSDEKLKTQQFKCPNCGGSSVFSPKHQKIKCEYCSSLFDLPSSEKVSEQHINELLSSSQNWNEAQVVQCQTCGGKQIVNNNEISVICSFCGATNLVATTEFAGIAPQGVVPFTIETNNTIPYVKRWAKSKFFAPSAFKKSIQPQNIQGAYYPVFTFDANTITTYNGRLYKNYTRTHRDSNGHTHTTTHTKHFNINGTHNQKFDDIVISASSSVSQTYLNQVQPFPTNTAIQYNQNYLNGFSALTYSKTGKECYETATQNMQYSIKRKILSKYDYSGISYFNHNTQFSNVSYKFVLLPLFIGHYTFKGKLYNFYINGHNGKVGGSAPVSAIKVILLILAIMLFLGMFILIPYIAEAIAIENF